MDSDKKIIEKKLLFLDELEKFGNIKRKIKKSNGETESDSEHSWFLAMFVMVFKDEILETGDNLDYTKMLEMALTHDLPEIYAGDIFPFEKGFDKAAKDESEEKAIKKLYNILPEKLQKRFFTLFDEYEEQKLVESQIIKAIDKIQPDHLNLIVKGENWKEHNLTYSMLVDYKKKHVDKNSFTKKLYFDFIMKSAIDKGYLKKE
ncbi:MAG: HD domain-containing protein [Nanoarchaeales archaeon]|nr:HD domain-containing protein [Nanoarchaeales archaeon]